MAYNPQVVDLKAFITYVGIMVERHIIGYPKVLRILNIYAPYSKRLEFWKNIFQFGLLDNRSLIVAGYFYLMLSMDEVWVLEIPMIPYMIILRLKLKR